MQRPTSLFSSTQIDGLAHLALIRTEFGLWLEAFEVAPERIADLSVVISELGANAVRSTPEGTPPPHVGAAIDGRRLVLTVSNSVGPGTSTPHEHEWDLDDPLRTGGRGLLLVSAFVDDVDVDIAEDRIVVRCTTAV